MPGDSTALRELLERVEKAEGADRELDDELLAALGHRYSIGFLAVTGWRWNGAWLGEHEVHPTASLDAALALVERVLPGWWWMARSHHGASAFAKVWRPLAEPPGNDFDAFAKTPALAFLAALLKAKIAEGEPMTAFTLDTSGVSSLWFDAGEKEFRPIEWSDLAPFTQGYIEALLRDFGDVLEAQPRRKGERPMLRSLIMTHRPARFSDLAPETLKRIMEDCRSKTVGSLETPTKYSGQRFWEERQAGRDAYFPPLTPYLGDDGKVYLRVGVSR